MVCHLEILREFSCVFALRRPPPNLAKLRTHPPPPPNIGKYFAKFWSGRQPDTLCTGVWNSAEVCAKGFALYGTWVHTSAGPSPKSKTATVPPRRGTCVETRKPSSMGTAPMRGQVPRSSTPSCQRRCQPQGRREPLAAHAHGPSMQYALDDDGTCLGMPTLPER